MACYGVRERTRQQQRKWEVVDLSTSLKHCLIAVTYSWWRHQMETFSVLLPPVRRIHRWPVDSPHKGQLRGALFFSLICAWTIGWINNREAGDVRRHRTHYEVTVMYPYFALWFTWHFFHSRIRRVFLVACCLFGFTTSANTRMTYGIWCIRSARRSVRYSEIDIFNPWRALQSILIDCHTPMELPWDCSQRHNH